MSPLYAVSACLAGIPCRYDGKASICPAVAYLVAAGKAIPFCPEVLGGLPIPRMPCERQGQRIITRNGQDVTDAFRQGAQRALCLAQQYGCRTAIVKSRSPSCGFGFIYDGTFSHRLCSGEGVWAGLLRQAGMQLFSEETLPPEL